MHVYHLQRSNIQLYDNCQVHIFLQKHFLHWIEALCLIGDLSEGILVLRTLESILTVSECTAVIVLCSNHPKATNFEKPKSDANHHLLAFVCDAKQVVLNTRSVIEDAPLQIYSSALVFTPRMSRIRGQFLSKALRWIKRTPTVPEDWDSSLQSLEVHSGFVNAVTFSPDGKLLASASDDNTIKLWEPVTGASRHTLEGHSDWVMAVAFSPDGKLLTSASHDMTVRLWDPMTRALRGSGLFSDIFTGWQTPCLCI
jgi:WD40 repeat protein